MKKTLLLILFVLLSQGTIFANNGYTTLGIGELTPFGAGSHTTGEGPQDPPDNTTGGGADGHTTGEGPQDPPDNTTGGGADGHTTGEGPTEPATPIDTNKAVLVITAALIAGAVGYRRTSLKKA